MLVFVAQFRRRAIGDHTPAANDDQAVGECLDFLHDVA